LKVRKTTRGRTVKKGAPRGTGRRIGSPLMAHCVTKFYRKRKKRELGK